MPATKKKKGRPVRASLAKQIVSLRMAPDLQADVKKMAARENRSFGNAVESLLRLGFAAMTKRQPVPPPPQNVFS